MPVTRTYQGRAVKRTHRQGTTIELWLAAGLGLPSERKVIPFVEYEREVLPHTGYSPSPQSGQGGNSGR